MTVPFVLMPDPKHDLVLEREIAVPVELVWKAWTVPEHMMQWFTPKPWKTVECSVDLRPGGRSDLVMESPEGQRFPNRGCYLVVEPNRRLVFTSALGEGFRPIAADPSIFPSQPTMNAAALIYARPTAYPEKRTMFRFTISRTF